MRENEERGRRHGDREQSEHKRLAESRGGAESAREGGKKDALISLSPRGVRLQGWRGADHRTSNTRGEIPLFYDRLTKNVTLLLKSFHRKQLSVSMCVCA